MAKGPSKRWMSMRALLVSSMRGAEVKSAEWRWSERSRKPSTETCRAFSRYFFPRYGWVSRTCLHASAKARRQDDHVDLVARGLQVQRAAERLHPRKAAARFEEGAALIEVQVSFDVVHDMLHPERRDGVDKQALHRPYVRVCEEHAAQIVDLKRPRGVWGISVRKHDYAVFLP
jgi:hypothetical protein